jgi:RNA polymerase sigma-70 factor (ECF subfamily)
VTLPTQHDSAAVPGAALRARLPDAVPALLAYARMLTGNEADAHDLVQDTLVRALESGDGLRDPGALLGWLRRVLHHQWIDRLRARREEPHDDLTSLVEQQWRDDDYTVDAAQVLTRAETRDELLDALAHLPAIYRTALVLHDGEGLTAAELAEASGITLASAKQRIRRGRMLLVTTLAHVAQTPSSPGVPMRCWQARSRVSDYLDDELDRATRQALESHLAGCRTCPPLYASLVGARDALAVEARSPDPDSVVPADLAARITGLLNPT